MDENRDLTMSPENATLLGVPLTLAAVAVVLVPFHLLWGGNPLVSAFKAVPWWLFAPMLVIAIAVHEALHALVWHLASARPRPRIRFGIHWRVLMPFAHPVTPLTARAYLLGAIAPGFLMGVLPGLIAFVLGNAPLAGWSAMFLAFAVGDMMVAHTLRHVEPQVMVQDHPSRVGCQIVDATPLSPAAQGLV